MLNKINRKKFYTIFIIIVIILIVVIIILFNVNFIKKEIAVYYYHQAEKSLYDFNNQASTDYLVKAINMDPELNSQEYSDFQDKRQEFLSDEENYNKYFNK